MKLTKEEIESLDNLDLSVKLFDITIEKVTADDNRSQREVFESFNNAEKVVFLGNIFLFEYYNGGLRQYFTNSSGEFCKETTDMFRQIGVNNSADVIERCLELFIKHSTSPEKLWEKLQNSGELYDIIYLSDVWDNEDLNNELEAIESAYDKMYPEEDAIMSKAIEKYIDSERPNLIN
jgi:hypothetical protein